MKKAFTSLLLITLLTTGANAQASESIQLVITKKDGSSYQTYKKGALVKRPKTYSESLEVPKDLVSETIQKLKAQKGVIAVERDIVVHAIGEVQPVGVLSSEDEVLPNDPSAKYQSYLLSRTEERPSANNIVNAWKLGEPKRRARVGIFDGGFLTEERFASDLNVTASYSFVNDEVKNTGDSGWDAEENTDCEDGHGIGVAGVVGAVRNNETFIAGISGNEADIYLGQVMRCGRGSLYSASRALRWAAGDDVEGLTTLKAPLDVVNFSMGSTSPCPRYFQEAVHYARAQGVMVVAGAGNDSIDVSKFSPASCEGVISVGALHKDTGDLSDFSNYGDTLDIVAQGTKMGSFANLDGNIGLFSGTSFAAPVVTGVFALAKAHAPTIDNGTLETLLKMTAGSLVDSADCINLGCGPGLADGTRFVEAAKRIEEGTIAEVTSTLSDTAVCDLTPYLMANGVKARLCSSYKVTIEDDLFTKYAGDVVIYRLYQWPKDRELNIDGDTIVFEGIETEYLTSDIDLELQAGLVRCANGQCDTSLVMPVTLANTGIPAECR